MISASPEPGFGTLVERLAARAEALAQARSETLSAERRNDPGRWRKAALLWPLFGRR